MWRTKFACPVCEESDYMEVTSSCEVCLIANKFSNCQAANACVLSLVGKAEEGCLQLAALEMSENWVQVFKI